MWCYGCFYLAESVISVRSQISIQINMDKCFHAYGFDIFRTCQFRCSIFNLKFLKLEKSERKTYVHNSYYYWHLILQIKIYMYVLIILYILYYLFVEIYIDNYKKYFLPLVLVFLLQHLPITTTTTILTTQNTYLQPGFSW